MDRNPIQAGPGFVLAVILWLVLDSSVLAQTPSITIGPIPLSLGMPKALTLSQLEKSFKLDCSDDAACDKVILMRKDVQFIGHVSFWNGKVSVVEKFWAPAFEDSDPGPFFKAFFNLLTKLQKEGYSVAHVKTNEFREPTGTFLDIALTFEGKEVSISYTEGMVIQGQKVRTFVHLNEVLK